MIINAAEFLDKQLRILGFPLVGVGHTESKLIVYLEKYDERIEDYVRPQSRFMDYMVEYRITGKIKPC